MSPADDGRRSPRSSQLIDAAEEVAADAGRLGYGLLSLVLGLLPRQSRTHMHNALRELSYAFVELPRTFADYARPPIEAWAAEADHAAAHAAAPEAAAKAALAPAQRVPITSEATTGTVAPSPPPPPTPTPSPPPPAARPAPPPPAAAARPAPPAGTAPTAGSTGAGKAAGGPAASPAGTGSTGAAGTGTPSASGNVAGSATPGSAGTGSTGAAGTGTPSAAGNVAGSVTPGSAGTGSTGAAGTGTSPGARPGLTPAGAGNVAVATGVAITHIEYDPPGRDVDGEYVLIRNGTAAPVDLTGWTLHDGKAIHTFIFPPFTLAPGAEVKLWTKAGANNAANLYWGERRAIWNNDGDTGTLKNAAGAVISSFTYAGSK